MNQGEKALRPTHKFSAKGRGELGTFSGLGSSDILFRTLRLDLATFEMGQAQGSSRDEEALRALPGGQPYTEHPSIPTRHRALQVLGCREVLKRVRECGRI